MGCSSAIRAMPSEGGALWDTQLSEPSLQHPSCMASLLDTAGGEPSSPMCVALVYGLQAACLTPSLCSLLVRRPVCTAALPLLASSEWGKGPIQGPVQGTVHWGGGGQLLLIS